MARVMIYGYDSTVAESKSIQNIKDLATKFNASLQKLTNASIVRPIILIGHSLGGLIIKQALISLSRSENEDEQNLIRAIYGIVFFRTPHDGMDITSLITMAGDSSPNRFIIESLSRNNSQILTLQQRDFHKALGDKGNSEVFCFYETLESPTAERKMTRPTAVLIMKSSAIHCRPWENGAEHICAINRTHSEMVKFGPYDPDYDNIRERVKGLQTGFYKTRSFADRQGDMKTQIAIAYAYWLQKMYQDTSVFWVHASNADRFRQSYASIAKKCNIRGHDDPKADILLLVCSWLKLQNKMQWLMIVDNADDVDLFFPNQLRKGSPGEDGHKTTPTTTTLTNSGLARYIPDCDHGSVLITTRDKKAGL
ncbi:hypothetical protein FP744_10006067 [Trichoderma asperellum]